MMKKPDEKFRVNRKLKKILKSNGACIKQSRKDDSITCRLDVPITKKYHVYFSVPMYFSRSAIHCWNDLIYSLKNFRQRDYADDIYAEYGNETDYDSLLIEGERIERVCWNLSNDLNRYFNVSVNSVQ